MKTVKIPIQDKTKPAEQVKVSSFKKEIRRTAPHRHNSYFEIIYLSAGSGFHTIDSRKYPVHPPLVFLVRKDQLHHFDLHTEADGYVAIIKKPFMDRSVDGELKKLLARLSSQQCLILADCNTIEVLFSLLVKELSGNQPLNFPVVEGLLKSVIGKILEVAAPIEMSTSGRSGIYHSFLSELQSSRPIKNSVQYYAGLLNTSPQNLNAACRKAVDQSATEILSEFIITEAKRLLLYTSNTVTEIAFALDFSDPSHFVKYFKRASGQTPLQFRNAC